MSTEARVTYRLQLHAGFDFAAAAAVADYLAELGVTHVYCSPYLQAAAGSTHGYDVVDPTRVNEELGGAAAHRAFVERLRRRRLGQLLDFVPNHMAITGPDNPWWWDVLENGPSSRYAPYFDVDWNPPEERLRDTILLPVLGDHYGCVLEAGGLRLERDGARFAIRYAETSFPVSPRTLDGLLAAAAARCDCEELAFLADAFLALPPADATDPDSLRKRHRNKAILGRQLGELFARQPAVAEAVDGVIAEMNTDPDALDALLERQNYRLSFWKAARHDLGYRRFFDIHTLIGLRMEDDRVFADTHALILRWVAEGLLDGLRLDHVDGLRDPERYLHHLRDACPQSWIVVEKILCGNERLRESWPVSGTTGYDFAARATGLLVDPDGERPLTELYGELTGEPVGFEEVVRDKKMQVLHGTLGSEVARLANLLLRNCERHRRYRDYSRKTLSDTVRELAASFPVYRTYVSAEAEAFSETDASLVEEAIDQCRARRPDLDPRLFDFLRDILLLRVRGRREGDFTMRLQQLTGALMAKAVEDTAFYCFNRFVALNEVGADPGSFGTPPDAFHRWCADVQRRWPGTLLATSTHDTKRSEDVRTRLCLLSEMPERWSAAVRRWRAANEPARTDGLPDRNTEYLFYQTLVGAWPIERARLLAYLEKAIREAKVHTSWTEPRPQYEDAVRRFVEAALDNHEFTDDVAAFVAPLLEPGRLNSLTQTLVKLTAPGVPDIYQGTELWDLSLVDPDNRRPVDFALRRRLLAEIAALTPEQILARSDEGLPKLWVTRQALHLRRRRPSWFGLDGGYEPLRARGARAEHVVAFARAAAAVTVTPRLVLRLGGDWQDTTVELPGGDWRNQLTGEEVAGGEVRMDELLGRFPVALLARNGATDEHR